MKAYSKINFKAYSSSCLNVLFVEKDSDFYWSWDKPINRKLISKKSKKEFISDTFAVLRDYALLTSDGNLYSAYLNKWGPLFYSPNGKINYYSVVSQSDLIMHIEHFLHFINNKELPPLLNELFSIWKSDMNRMGTPAENDIPEGYLVNTLFCKYWTLLPPHNNYGYYWLPGNRKPHSNEFFLYITKPEEEDIQEMIDNAEFRNNYFKKSIMQNIELYINKYMTHHINVDENGNINIESTCSSLLAYYIFTLLENFKDEDSPDKFCFACGKLLTGRQKTFCSTQCKDNYYNNSDAKRVDRWINKMAYDKKITSEKSEELRLMAKDLFDKGENVQFIKNKVKEQLI